MDRTTDRNTAWQMIRDAVESVRAEHAARADGAPLDDATVLATVAKRHPNLYAWHRRAVLDGAQEVAAPARAAIAKAEPSAAEQLMAEITTRARERVRTGASATEVAAIVALLTEDPSLYRQLAEDVRQGRVDSPDGDDH